MQFPKERFARTLEFYHKEPAITTVISERQQNNRKRSSSFRLTFMKD